MVPGAGIEPALSFENQILSLARLPVPPPRQERRQCIESRHARKHEIGPLQVFRLTSSRFQARLRPVVLHPDPDTIARHAKERVQVRFALGVDCAAILCRTLIQRARRIIRPAGKLILSMNSNEKVESELLHSLGILKALGA